ncbi:MAG: LytR cell envelope-related transcriptional attenuator [Acidimicrobiaceae bacterium]|jgi:hypothetical protein
MRGALLVAAAVLLGAGLLANGFRDDNVSTGAKSTTQTTRTTAPGGTGTTTVVQAHDPAQVKVLILNGSGKSGVAKAAKDQLAAANYTVLEPGNAKGGTVTASIVYFVPGYDADAQTIAAKLGLPASAAQPLPNPVPDSVADAQGANIVVIIGTDAPVAGGAGAGTTPSTAPTTTAN